MIIEKFFLVLLFSLVELECMSDVQMIGGLVYFYIDVCGVGIFSVLDGELVVVYGEGLYIY